jgi:hypothetical protein
MSETDSCNVECHDYRDPVTEMDALLARPGCVLLVHERSKGQMAAQKTR